MVGKAPEAFLATLAWRCSLTSPLQWKGCSTYVLPSRDCVEMFVVGRRVAMTHTPVQNQRSVWPAHRHLWAAEGFLAARHFLGSNASSGFFGFGLIRLRLL